jgi:hypothetical protein
VLEPEPAVSLDEPPAEDERGQADREVDEEDPVPAERLGEDPAGEKAERAPGDRHEHVRAHRPCALARPGELGDDDREDHRGLGGGADALHEAGGNQRALARRNAAQERGSGKRDETREEHAPAAGEIAEPSREQEQAPERDQERVDDPREARLAEVEVALNRGQRDIHDRDVEHDHQLRQAHDHECRPATAVR